MSRLIRLYPAAWRARYGPEMAELLDARPATMRDRIDLARGALDAHVHPTWQAGRRPLVARVLSPDDARLVRRAGVATIAGGFVWPLVPIVAMTGPIVFDDAGAYRDGSAGIPLALVAGFLLMAGLLGQLVRLPDEARWARRAAASAIPFVLLYVAAPWLFPIGGVALGLIAVVAIAARRAHAWSTAPAIAVVVPAVAAVGLTLFAVATYTGDRIASSTFVYVGVAMLIPIWLAVGGTLLAGEPATPSR